MSRFRDEYKLDKDDEFGFEDSQIIKKLLETNKLTDKQKLALSRLYKTYNYITS